MNNRTGEWLDTVYWIEGEYVPDALEAANHILRDWRQEEAIAIDRRTLDIISAVHRKLDTEDPVEVLSGYRTPATNAMLRRRSRGVARNSYHMRGMACDLRVASRSCHQVHRAARAVNEGGVGLYSRSNFVHVDSGPVRNWGR